MQRDTSDLTIGSLPECPTGCHYDDDGQIRADGGAWQVQPPKILGLSPAYRKTLSAWVRRVNSLRHEPAPVAGKAQLALFDRAAEQATSVQSVDGTRTMSGAWPDGTAFTYRQHVTERAQALALWERCTLIVTRAHPGNKRKGIAPTEASVSRTKYFAGDEAQRRRFNALLGWPDKKHYVNQVGSMTTEKAREWIDVRLPADGVEPAPAPVSVSYMHGKAPTEPEAIPAEPLPVALTIDTCERAIMSAVTDLEHAIDARADTAGATQAVTLAQANLAALRPPRPYVPAALASLGFIADPAPIAAQDETTERFEPVPEKARKPRAIDAAREARASNALDVKMTINGRNLATRREHVTRMVAEGYRVERTAKGRRLAHPSGAFFLERDVTKAAVDYAETLIAALPEATARTATIPVPASVPVASSNIAAIGYDAARELLRVEFLSGSVYQYENVTPADHAALMAASSHGSHFSRYIKAHPDRFPCTKVDPEAEAAARATEALRAEQRRQIEALREENARLREQQAKRQAARTRIAA